MDLILPFLFFILIVATVAIHVKADKEDKDPVDVAKEIFVSAKQKIISKVDAPKDNVDHDPKA